MNSNKKRDAAWLLLASMHSSAARNAPAYRQDTPDTWPFKLQTALKHLSSHHHWGTPTDSLGSPEFNEHGNHRFLGSGHDPKTLDPTMLHLAAGGAEAVLGGGRAPPTVLVTSLLPRLQGVPAPPLPHQ